MTGHNGLPFVTCPEDGKRAYLSKKDAKKAEKLTNPGAPLSAYPCGAYWHIGNMPAVVRTGAVARTELLPTKRRGRKIRGWLEPAVDPTEELYAQAFEGPRRGEQ